MTSLSVDFAGLKLSNPLVVSAGPLTANTENVKRLADAGIGAVVTKTGFIEEEYYRWVGRKDIFPYKPVYKYQSLDNGTLLALPTLCDVPASEMARRVAEMKDLGIPIIASIMGLSVKGYRESATLMEDAGADAIELDLCCPIPEFLLQYKYAGQNATMSPKIYAKLVNAVKRSVEIPVGAKSTFSPFSSPQIVEGLIRAKLKNSCPDFVTLTGQLAKNPGVDLDTLEPLYPFPVMGWHGELKELTYAALSMTGTTFGIENPRMSASGGIRTHEDVITSLALGATTVQLNTVILDKGPRWVGKLVSGLTGYLEDHGLSSVNELIGVSLKGYIPSLALGEYMRERDKLFSLVYAVVNNDLCDGCGLCEQLCPEEAIIIENNEAVVTEEKCRGCNLCVLKCPHRALSLKNQDKLQDLIDHFIGSRGDSVRLEEFMAKSRVGLLDKLRLFRDMKALGLA